MCVIDVSPEIETRRLLLRAPEARDVHRLAALADDYDVTKMTLRMPYPYTLADAVAFVARCADQDRRRDNTFVIESERDGPVGVVGFFMDRDPWPELGYWLGRPFWGRGYATEAVEGVLGWAAKSWRKKAIGAGHFADNPASGRVLEKAGFLYTGEVRRSFSRARGAEADAKMMLWLA